MQEVVRGEIVACDATFIKAYSKRDPKDDSKGYSDPDARFGRTEKGYRLGYKLHLAVDANSDLPLGGYSCISKRKRKEACTKAYRESHTCNG